MRLFVASVWGGGFAQIKSLPYLCSRNQKPSLTKARKNGRDRNDSVAQLVEQVTLNHWVVSSSLTGVTSQAGITSLEVIPAFFFCRRGAEVAGDVPCTLVDKSLYLSYLSYLCTTN